MPLESGFITIDRKMLSWEWFDQSSMVQIWVFILLSANWRDGKFHGVDVPRGSFITSVRKIVTLTNLSPNTVRRCLEKLEKTGEISVKVTHSWTMINVLKYNEYQSTDEKIYTPIDTPPDTACDTPPDTVTDTAPAHNRTNKQCNKETKKQEKIKDIHAIFEKFTSNPEMLELLDEWIENRKVRRTPNTVSAIQKNLDKLHDLAVESNMEDQEYLSEIVRLGWAAFYPIRSKDQQKTFKQLDEEREDAKYVHNIGEVLDDKPF